MQRVNLPRTTATHQLPRTIATHHCVASAHARQQRQPWHVACPTWQLRRHVVVVVVLLLAAGQPPGVTAPKKILFLMENTFTDQTHATNSPHAGRPPEGCNYMNDISQFLKKIHIFISENTYFHVALYSIHSLRGSLDVDESNRHGSAGAVCYTVVGSSSSPRWGTPSPAGGHLTYRQGMPFLAKIRTPLPKMHIIPETKPSSTPLSEWRRTPPRASSSSI